MFESRRPDTTDTAMRTTGSRLVVGDLRVDPASLVAVVALTRAGASAALEVIEPTAADRAARVAAVSPTSRLPVLVDHGTTIWEPMAILEWAAEGAPNLWPAHARRRAVARAVVAELHGGLAALRQQLPFDWFARYRLREEPPAAVQVDLHRLAGLWRNLLEDGGGFLFGPRAGLADLAMVPIVGRLRTYDLWPRDPTAAAYAERVLALEEVAAAFEASAPEPALAKPPPLAVPARVDDETGGGTEPVRERARPAAPPPRATAPAGGPRKLEEVVARARQRERQGPVPPRGPAVEPPPVDPAPPLRAPAPPEAPHAPVRGAGEAPPGREDGGEPARPSRRGGMSWLRRGRVEPPGGGRRRRPPGRG